MIFENRADAAQQLARELAGMEFNAPLVLAIPRGGVVIGNAIATQLGAELDVLLCRKLRSPSQSELAIGALAEDGKHFLTEYGKISREVTPAYLDREIGEQKALIDRRRRRFRVIRPAAAIAGRSVILTDDGIATGSTMIAAIEWLRTKAPRDITVAIPVAPWESVAELQKYCDRLVVLSTPADFWAIGQHYEEFDQVDDDEVERLLIHHLPPSQRVAGRYR